MMATTQLKTSFLFNPAATAGSPVLLTDASARKAALAQLNLPQHFKALPRPAVALSPSTASSNPPTPTIYNPAAGSSVGAGVGVNGPLLETAAVATTRAAAAAATPVPTDNKTACPAAFNYNNDDPTASATSGFNLQRFDFAIPAFAAPPKPVAAARDAQAFTAMPPPPPRPTKRRKTGAAREISVAYGSREEMLGCLPHPVAISTIPVVNCPPTIAAPIAAPITTSAAVTATFSNTNNSFATGIGEDGVATRPSSPASPYTSASSDAESSSSSDDDDDDDEDASWMLQNGVDDELKLLDDLEAWLDEPCATSSTANKFDLPALDAPGAQLFAF